VVMLLCVGQTSVGQMVFDEKTWRPNVDKSECSLDARNPPVAASGFYFRTNKSFFTDL